MSGFVGICRVLSCSPAGKSIASTMERKMKITKQKGMVPAKRKSAVLEKQEHMVPSHKAAVEGRTEHWAQWIEPKGAALLSETLGPVYFVVKNHGANNIRLVADHGDLMDLPPGAVRATYAYGIVRVENPGEKSVLIEFEFLPIFRK
jgi:hypothetical protein